MGAVGTSADNAAAEAFNASLKRETLQGARRWPSAQQARLAVFTWIIRYNTRRRHSSLNYLSPIDYEQRADRSATRRITAGVHTLGGTPSEPSDVRHDVNAPTIIMEKIPGSCAQSIDFRALLPLGFSCHCYPLADAG
jgi:hypothetical protein